MSPPLSERFERSRAGRALLAALVVLVVLAGIGTNLPPSALARAVEDPAGRLVRLAAVEQVWGVFAPNPRSTSLRLEAVVTYADGSTSTWTIPDGPRIGANLRFYRWRKWLERVRSDGHSDLWEPMARWIASIHDDGPSPVAKVELVRLFHDNVVEGEQPEWQRYRYFELDLAAP